MSFLRPQGVAEWATLTVCPLITVMIVLLLRSTRDDPWGLSVIHIGGTSEVQVVLTAIPIAFFMHGIAYLVLRALRPFLTD